jgi:hypothetical protein
LDYAQVDNSFFVHNSIFAVEIFHVKIMKDEKNIEEAQVTTPEGGGADGIIAFVNENIPELKDATPEEKFAAVLTTLEKNKVFHEKMEALFQSEPLLGQLISGVMRDEKSFLEVMAEIISPDEYAAALENEGGDVLKTRDERLGKLKEMEERDATLSANVSASAGNIEAWLATKDWDDTKKQDFMERVSAIFEILADGKITDAELEQFANMIYFDDAVSQAREEGIVVGRNEQIDDKRLKDKVTKGTDGLPALSGGGNAGMEKDKPAEPANPFSDVIRMREKKIY